MRAYLRFAAIASATLAALAGCIGIVGDFPVGNVGTDASVPDGTTDSPPPPPPDALPDSPVDAGPDAMPLLPTDPVALALGAAHACVILQNHQMYCWGKDQYGETGAAPGGTQTTLTPHVVPWLGGGSDSWAFATAGESHTCAVDTNQNVWCFGQNDRFQLGNYAVPQDGGSTPTPQHVVNDVSAYIKVPSQPNQLSASQSFTCANFEAQGGTWCWGTSEGPLNGTDGGKSSPRPNQVPLPTDAGAWTALTVGALHGCVAFADTAPSVWCWGGNKLAELGDGTSVDGPGVVVKSKWQASFGVPQSLASGIGHNCALTADGSVYCWGFNGNGETGQASSGPADLTLVPTKTTAFDALPGTTTRIGAAGTNTCVVRGAKVYCIGANESGQLGVAAIDDPDAGTPHSTPIGPVTGLDNAVEVAVGGIAYPLSATFYGGFACAIKQDVMNRKRRVFCWGANDHGQLGNGNPSAKVATPVEVQGLP